MKILFTLVFLVLLPACSASISGARPTDHSTGTNDGTFKGYYTNAFETSAFVPCGSVESNDLSTGYWLSSTPASNFYERHRALIASLATPGTPAPPFSMVFVRFEGTLSPQGHYGHLSAFDHEVTVTKVIDMALPNETQCS